MDKNFSKYMKWGKTVESSWTGETFKLVEDMKTDKPTVLTVKMSNWSRYDMLKAWLRNWEHDNNFRERFTGNIEECRQEKTSYEEELKVSDITPSNLVRFITPNYETLFSVKDLSKVKVNGKIERVVYLDETHFTFAEGKSFYGCFHICQFAEICQQNGTKVEPV